MKLLKSNLNIITNRQAKANSNKGHFLWQALFFVFVCSITNSQAQKKMITPPVLQKGDTVAIVATARKNIEDNLQPTIDLLHSWGLEVVIGSTIG